MIWFYDSDYNYISGNYILILKKTGSFDWTKFELFFAVPSEASFMRLGLKPLGTQGSYGYIDSVSLIEIPANRVGFAPVHAVHVKDLYNKGTFYGSEIYTGIWHYADYVLFVDYLGTTNANPITLDVTVQSYDNETGQWFDCVVFDTVEAPDDSHPVNDKTYVKVATAGLGYKQRVKLLLENDINLFGLHLPLDAHMEIGNNAEIARVLGVRNPQPFGEYNGRLVGVRGELPAVDAQELLKTIRKEVNPDALSFMYGPDKINKIGIISGGAQKNVTQAVEAELDMYITGEVSEHILNYVKEEGIHFISAGHYATERFGVLALGRHLEKQFDVEVEFIDIPNPV